MARDLVCLVEHFLHVPLGLVVQDQARSEVAARPDLSCQRCRRVLDADVLDSSVTVAVDLEAVPFASVKPQRPRSEQLAGRHAAAEIGFEAGDAGKRPDTAIAEAEATCRILEGLPVVTG